MEEEQACCVLLWEAPRRLSHHALRFQMSSKRAPGNEWITLRRASHARALAPARWTPGPRAVAGALAGAEGVRDLCPGARRRRRCWRRWRRAQEAYGVPRGPADRGGDLGGAGGGGGVRGAPARRPVPRASCAAAPDGEERPPPDELFLRCARV